MDQREVAYVYEELWLGKSVISKQTDRLALTRWDRSKPLSLTNTVCMTKEEADAHDKLPSDVDLRDHYGQGARTTWVSVIYYYKAKKQFC